VRFEQDPNNAEMLNTIFRLVHTLKGTCGFLGLARLAKLEHAAETLMANIATAPRLRLTASASSSRASTASSKILEGLERDGVEPQGSNADLIGSLQALACQVLCRASTKFRWCKNVDGRDGPGHDHLLSQKR